MKRITVVVLAIMLLISTTGAIFPTFIAQEINASPPDSPVRLIFIHHSTGENWLNDENGGLARALQQNNYYPSDTNYGWGPDAIGDRTDIPNWPEWFRSPNTPRIMQAVFTENEVHSPFERTLPDPGGENQIILFKSCFPNSALDGNPNDPPSPGSDLTVGNAKYVYNEILQYFKSRPDKLFVVITAPPLSDGTHASNARAFNEWLVNNWLKESNYTQPNVAVFDFYNILTGPNNHHRFTNGSIEHVTKDKRNTEYYPSEDDHPNRQGNQKATTEFLPMLNIFYNRWQAAGPAAAQAQETAPDTQPEQPQEAPAAPVQPAQTAAGMLFDFETGQPEWDANVDEAVQDTALDCQSNNTAASSGTQSLQITFNVAAESWATCSSFFDSPRDLSSSDGIQFMLLVDQPGNVLHFDVFTETGDERATYAIELPFTQTGQWEPVQIFWTDLKRVEWETDGGSTFSHPEQVAGVAFGFPAGETVNQGTIHIDAIQTITSGGEPAAVENPAVPQAAVIAEQDEDIQEEPVQKKTGFLPFCGSIILVPFGTLALWTHRKPNL